MPIYIPKVTKDEAKLQKLAKKRLLEKFAVENPRFEQTPVGTKERFTFDQPGLQETARRTQPAPFRFDVTPEQRQEVVSDISGQFSQRDIESVLEGKTIFTATPEESRRIQAAIGRMQPALRQEAIRRFETSPFTGDVPLGQVSPVSEREKAETEAEFDNPLAALENLQETGAGLVLSRPRLRIPGFDPLGWAAKQDEVQQKAEQLRKEGYSTFEAAAEAFRQTDFPPGVKGALLLVFDPLNLLPGVGWGGAFIKAGVKGLKIVTKISLEILEATGSKAVIRLVPETKKLMPSQAGVQGLGREVLERGLPKAPDAQIGQVQPGFGIGEQPAQGQLLGEFQGKAQKSVPLIDEDALLGKQAREAELARGQQPLPETAAAAGKVTPEPKIEAPPKAGAVAKEPWEMTTEEFVSSLYEKERYKNISPISSKDYIREREGNLRDRLANMHLDIMEKAVQEGKPVPVGNKPMWMRTQQEHINYDLNRLREAGNLEADSPDMLKAAKDDHRAEVKDALEDGLLVPPKVLADYPDLAKTIPEKTPPITRATTPAEVIPPSSAGAPEGDVGRLVDEGSVPPDVPSSAGATPLGADMPNSQKVLDRISFAEPGPGLIERIRRGWHAFNKAMLDELHPISEFVKAARVTGAEVSFDEDPYIWARLLKGNISKANVMIEKGTFGKKFWKMEGGRAVPNIKGPGLEDILKPVGASTAWRDFTVYLTAKRAVTLSLKNIKTGIGREEALQAITELTGKYKDFPQIAKRLYRYQNDVLDYAQEMGLLSRELVTKLKGYESYIPFHRVFEEVQARGFMGKKMASIASPIKKMKGSGRVIINPLESVVKNTYLLLHAADYNMVGIMMANLAEKSPELAGLFRKIPTPTARVARVTAKELGISMEGLSAAETEAIFNVFRPSMFSRDNVLTVLVDGKRQFFEVDPELYKGLLAMDRESMGMIGQFLSYPAKWLRAGATLSPDFMVRNPLRDQLTAFVYSKYGFLPGIDWLKGISHIFRKTDEYTLYRMSGAERSMLVSMDRQYLQKSFKEIVEGKGFTDYIKHPLDILQVLSELGEKGTRMGEFLKGIKAGAPPGEAGFASREVTLDFAKMGTTARAINNIIAFFNANIRGWDIMIQSFKNHPVRTSTKVFLGITLPSILLYAVNRNNPRYHEIPQWQKDLFWIVIIPDGPIVRIPKPFELGIIFGSIPERFLEAMDTKDPSMLNEALRNAAEAGTPGLIPTFMLPIIENMSNHSFFRDRPIVSRSREDFPPALQYGGTTSESAKKLGEWINYSPAKIENILNGWTGGLGRYAIAIMDKVLEGTGIVNPPPDPSRTAADIPVLKAFIVRDPYGSSSESVDRFYKQLKEYEKHEKFLKEMMKLGEKEKYEAYKAKHSDALFVYDFTQNDFYSASARYFRKIARMMSDIRKRQTDIYNSRILTPDVKREKIDEANKAITNLAQAALARYSIGAKQTIADQLPQPAPEPSPPLGMPGAVPISPPLGMPGAVPVEAR